jgi:hypothetical protein
LLESYGEQNVNNELENRVNKMLVERGLSDTESNRTRIAGELGKQIILANPVRYVILHLQSDIQGLYPDDSLPMILGIDISRSPLEILKDQGLVAAIRIMRSDYQNHLWVLAVLLLLTLLLLFSYLGWALGTLHQLWERQFFSLVFLSLPIFYQLLIPGDVSYARFRVPVMPFICILAAIGLVALKDRIYKLKFTPKLFTRFSSPKLKDS